VNKNKRSATSRLLPPQRMSFPEGKTVRRLELGDHHAGCILGSSLGQANEVWMWGANICGQLGNGGTDYQLSPVRVDLPPGVQVLQLKLGATSSACILDTCTGQPTEVWHWGTFSTLTNTT